MMVMRNYYYQGNNVIIPTCSMSNVDLSLDSNGTWVPHEEMPVYIETYDYCNVGYSPSTQPEVMQGYESQSGSSCPCTCYPDNVKYPTAYETQHNCKAPMRRDDLWFLTGECLDTVRYVSSDDTSCVTYMCISTCMCSHV